MTADYDKLKKEMTKFDKKRLNDEREEHYVKLNHDPGTAQANFCEFIGIDPDIGKKTRFKFLVLTFPHSNGHFCRVVPSENTECFLEALKSMFEEIGGAPTVIWFDNLSTAVSDIFKNGLPGSLIGKPARGNLSDGL